jgi:2-hydroxy-3-keto-5-methylthiopentenyl-1-phosphate phosphatase
MNNSDFSKVVLLIDFDGTIVSIDTAEFALDRFADPSWRLIDEEFERGEVTFEESLRKEFLMIKVPEKMILDELEKVTELRPNFGKLVEYCKTHNLSLIVVSGGLDFCIRHFLGRNGWLKFVEIHAPRSEFTANGYTLIFPELFDRSSTSFKDDLVKYYRRQGSKVIYIGNGLGDYPAAKEADISFAVKGSKLAELCKKGHLACREITDFQQVVDALQE